MANRDKNRERDRAAYNRWAAKNAEDLKARAKARYEKNRAKRIAQAREWNRRNKKKRSIIMAFQNAKRRSRIKANGGRGFTKAHWRELVTRFDGLCAYCRKNPSNSIDHFVPISSGGQDDFANIVPACKHCNAWKREKEPTAWVIARFGTRRLSAVLRLMLK